MLGDRMKVAPETVAHTDTDNRRLMVELAVPRAPAYTIDVQNLKDSVRLTTPARDLEYVPALALMWPEKSDKAQARYHRVRFNHASHVCVNTMQRWSGQKSGGRAAHDAVESR